MAKKDILAALEEYGAGHVFAYGDIVRLLEEKRDFWRLPQNLSAQSFVKLLLEQAKFKRYEIDFPTRRIIRFSLQDVSALKIAASLEPDSYLTHYTAVYLNNLTEQSPKTIYVNREQSPKRMVASGLSQSNIDRAFSRPARASRNIAELGSYKVCLLSGKHTGGLGVVDLETTDGETVRVTGVERTLIDIAVRPWYAGGVYQVLNAYRRASGVVSVNRLVALLQKIEYIYPYHQVVGFYLDKSRGYNESQVALLKQFEMKFDFYLTHAAKETEYSEEWRLHYPKGL